uniref:Negative regulator of systemic acquired resistance SNI1 n=1 Tax=Davidia involucrata TaxID=16924 RepID=A0A5B7AXL5_DAVIN
METRRRGNRGIEENTMAILDLSGFSKNSQHVNDDRIAFLEAVRSASIVPENGIPPTNKMFEAIFQILKDEKSLDLIMASYQLLNELDKRFPRVYISKTEKSKSPSPSTVSLELAVVKEAWSPFIFGVDVASGEREEANKKSGGSLDASAFLSLIQDLAKVADETKFEATETKFLRNMLLFQYLVSVLEGDFLPRNSVFTETMNWIHLRESLLNMLLVSRRISYKGLVKDCLSVLCEICHVHNGFSHETRYPENSSEGLLKSCDAALAIALPEVEKCTCIAVQKLLMITMELDLSKKKADMQGLTTRADGVRTPVVEIILDELTYNRDILSPFFQDFNEPKWKLEIVVQYFWKYIAKPSVRTRRSNGSTDNATFDGLLKCFSNGNSTKNITKKISPEVTQLLLAHGFQAFFVVIFPRFCRRHL